MINVIFDLDGTLIDSANAISSAVNDIRKDLKLEILKKDEILKIINTPNINWAKKLYGIDNFENKGYKEGFEKYFLKHYKESVISFDGIKNVLDFLKEKKCFLAIATNAPQESILTILKQQNLNTYFDKILGVSLGIKAKPDPMMLNLIIDEAPYEKSIFIGDSKKDEQSAKIAKIPYINAKWGDKIENKNEFSNYEELINLLKDFMRK